MTNHIDQTSQRRAARIAGAMYLMTMATSIGELAFRSSFMVPGDATKTAENIKAAEWLFRLNVVVDLATVSGLIVLTWALYVLLRPVNRDLAVLAAFFRLVENALIWFATVNSLVALRLLSGADYLKTFEAGQLHSLARLALSVRGPAYDLGFILLGLGSAVFAYLLLKSRYVPRALAAWGLFASVLMAASAVLTIVFPSAVGQLQMISFLPMFIYEVTLGFWLLVKGARVPQAGG